jgi:hypothetical protein
MRYSIDRIGLKGVHALAVAIKQNKTLEYLDLSIVINNIKPSLHGYRRRSGQRARSTSQ